MTSDSFKLGSPCPANAVDDFLSGTLSGRQLTEFEEHLGHCVTCEQHLRQGSADEMFWQDTSRFLKSMDETKRPTNDSMESSMVAWLDPTDDPASLGRWAGYEVTA